MGEINEVILFSDDPHHATVEEVFIRAEYVYRKFPSRAILLRDDLHLCDHFQESRAICFRERFEGWVALLRKADLAGSGSEHEVDTDAAQAGRCPSGTRMKGNMSAPAVSFLCFSGSSRPKRCSRHFVRVFRLASDAAHPVRA